ncbi:MBL fold metallo-hydrolase [Neobacillus dielmonensis]|uniref:MBL fold metallo-hydrolase n=1 Tax=Neobacillus dielmonensis TaxID=1347369 RepID=UPI0005A7C4EE|nr:MBL fold metallo-hydrolase [Neobacillus dielmonensis]
MKLTIIGPWGGYPKVNAASAGYLLEHEGFRLLIDCGSGVLAKLQNIVQPEQLDAVIISHYHPDHIADIGVLQHARLIQGYLGKDMDTLPVYGHQSDQQEFSKLSYKNIMKGIAYEPNQELRVGPFKVTFLKTDHPVPCYAMRFEAGGKAIVYTADSSFKEEFISFSQGAEVLVCECNFYANQNGKSAGHMNSTDAGRFAREADVKQLILTHLPHYGNLTELLDEASKEYTGIIKLAEEFQVITI